MKYQVPLSFLDSLQENLSLLSHHPVWQESCALNEDQTQFQSFTREYRAVSPPCTPDSCRPCPPASHLHCLAPTVGKSAPLVVKLWHILQYMQWRHVRIAQNDHKHSCTSAPRARKVTIYRN